MPVTKKLGIWVQCQVSLAFFTTHPSSFFERNASMKGTLNFLGYDKVDDTLYELSSNARSS